MEILPIWMKYPDENMGLYINVTSKYTRENIPVGIQHQTTNVSIDIHKIYIRKLYLQTRYVID